MLAFMELLQDEMKAKPTEKSKPLTSPESIYSSYFQENRSFINTIFAGQQETVVTCSTCQFRSVTYLPFLELVLPIKGMDSLDECLRNYFQDEKLEDLYECEKCSKRRKAVKSTSVTKTPNYLIIVLKKFSPTTFKKIEERIKYSFDVSLKKYCMGHCGETNYHLSSIIIHKGSKSNKGHYYTLARRKERHWTYFNDHIVKEMEQQSEVLGRDPYILIYERRKKA
jgi:ubiquitin C-terminal hydrolase